MSKDYSGVKVENLNLNFNFFFLERILQKKNDIEAIFHDASIHSVHIFNIICPSEVRTVKYNFCVHSAQNPPLLSLAVISICLQFKKRKGTPTIFERKHTYTPFIKNLAFLI